MLFCIEQNTMMKEKQEEGCVAAAFWALTETLLLTVIWEEGRKKNVDLLFANKRIVS